jgi:chemotaxis protein methyltransferase CheR
MALTSFDSAFLRKLVRDRSGIVLGEDKTYLIESRLMPVARLHGLASLDGLVAKLRSNPPSALLKQVIEAMTTNETLFFRDAHPFEILGKLVLPDLMKKRAEQKTLSVWCAAASTGQEPYSLAMTIREQVPGLLNGWKLRMIGTDLSSEVLARARAGIYSQLEVARGMPAPLLAKYFQRQTDGTWLIREDLRQMFEFRELNLLDTYPFGDRFDIVLMRNVLIYFDLDTKRQILAKVRRVMAPDGYFFLGGAETTMNIDDAFERVNEGRGGGYRLRQPAAVTAGPA